MKKLLSLLALTTAFTNPAWSARQTVTLSVEGMTCAACPLTVKQALRKVKGVSKAEVSYEKRQAVVSFDETQTHVQALTQATANAGYPSTVKQQAPDSGSR